MKMLIIPVTFEISEGSSNFNWTFLNSRVIIRYSKVLFCTGVKEACLRSHIQPDKTINQNQVFGISLLL